MQISAVEATQVAVPRLARYLPKTAHGEVDVSRYVLVRLRTDAGIDGLGEVTCAVRWSGEDSDSSTQLLRGPISAAVVGADPFRRREILNSIRSLTTGRPFLRASIDMALLDVAARALGIRVCELLGGAVRERIATKFVLPARDPDLVAELAAEAITQGAMRLKVKVGLDLSTDLKRVQRVRETVGEDVPISVDANEGWSYHDAATALPALEALGVCAAEQPVSRDSEEFSASLRTRSGVPLMADESVWSARDAFRIAAHSSFDMLSLYPGKLSGVDECMAAAAIAQAAGLDVTIGSNLELGVGTAMMLHLAATLPELSERVASDIVGPLFFEHSLVTNNDLVNWHEASVPRGTGLGVELDVDAVARYAVI